MMEIHSLSPHSITVPKRSRFLKMLEFVAPFNAKIVIMINVTRFVILGAIRKGRYSGSILQCDAV